MATKVFLHGDESRPIVAAAARLLEVLDPRVTRASSLAEADFAIAPFLRRRLSAEELETPTLIFHPSLLPRHRGRDAIKWAVLDEQANYSGVTWFWANEELDAGDICEQGVVEIRRGYDTPRDFYEKAIAEGLRLLEYALLDLAAGIVRRRPQRAEAATYEAPYDLPKRTRPSVLEMIDAGCGDGAM